MPEFEFRFQPKQDYGSDWHAYFADYTTQRNQAKADAGVDRSALERKLEAITVLEPAHTPDVTPTPIRTLTRKCEDNGFRTKLLKSVTEEDVVGERRQRVYHALYGVKPGRRFVAQRRDNTWEWFTVFDENGTHPLERLKDFTEWMGEGNELRTGGDGLFSEEELLQEGRPG